MHQFNRQPKKPPVRHQPRLDYCGLTILMSNASRFDVENERLLVADGGGYFCNECLAPDFNRFQCDIRTLECKDPLLPNTKCILLMGQTALTLLHPQAAQLNAQRGSPLAFNGIPVISTYLPQDAKDMKDYEGEFNPILNDTIVDDEGGVSPAKESAKDEKSRHGKTNRKNWRFWLKQDVRKACKIVLNGGSLPTENKVTCHYHIYPNASDVIGLLTNTKGKDLYFDIETDADLNITCFAFSFDYKDTYVVPIFNHSYNHAYSNLSFVFRALSVAIRDNCLVAHNGANFDFFVLGHKYRIPIGHKTFDTMLAQNRCFPEVEKSLGHCISLPWMFEQYHKDEGSFAYGNKEQALNLWKYCGKDVGTLAVLKRVQLEYAAQTPGLLQSIEAVQSYVRPYLITTLMGIAYDEKEIQDTTRENDKLMMQYIRIIEHLVGDKFLKVIRGKSKAAMAGSPKQCAGYFYDMLKYPVQGKTKTGVPAVDKKALFKLKLKFNNPVIDFIIAYRSLAKETGVLKFNPWKEKEELPQIV